MKVTRFGRQVLNICSKHGIASARGPSNAGSSIANSQRFYSSGFRGISLLKSKPIAGISAVTIGTGILSYVGYSFANEKLTVVADTGSPPPITPSRSVSIFSCMSQPYSHIFIHNFPFCLHNIACYSSNIAHYITVSCKT